MRKSAVSSPARLAAASKVAARSIAPAAERMFSTLVGNLPGMAYRCRNNENWTMEYISSGVHTLTGFHPDDFMGEQPVVEVGHLIHPHDRERIWTEVQCALAARRQFTLEYRIRNRDGHYFWVWERGCGVWRADGPLEALEGLILDIDERKRVESELLRFRAAMDHSSDGVFIIDPETSRITDCNARAHVSLGLTREELLESGVTDIAPELPEHFLWDEHVRETREKGQVTFYGSHRRKDGSIFPVDVNVRYVASTPRDFMIAVVRDASERRATETRIAAQVQELERSNRELEHFAHVASHDLQEPLRTVNRYTQLLVRNPESTESQEYGAFVTEAVGRMTEQLDGLLAYSRISRGCGELKRVDLNGTLTDVIANLNDSINAAGARISSDRLPSVQADARLLPHVFQNLLANAIKFRREEAPCIHVGAEHSLGNWVISVRDNGIGIASRHAQRIFALFQRLHTRDSIPGHGLGLAICRRIVERHGGKIWVEPGDPGSIFKFTLPAGDTN